MMKAVAAGLDSRASSHGSPPSPSAFQLLCQIQREAGICA